MAREAASATTSRSRFRGLYLVADPDLARGRDLVEIVRLALAGGARIVQYRDKRPEKRPLYELALRLRDLCAAANGPFIVNDHVDLALAVEADGVHVGQKDLPVAAIRRFAPPGFIVGCSCNTVEEALAAERDGADYLGVGSMYPTTSKSDTRPAGLDALHRIRAAVRLPIVAIGGINAANACPVLEAGADGLAVLSAIVSADDPEAASRELAAICDEGRRTNDE